MPNRRPQSQQRRDSVGTLQRDRVLQILQDAHPNAVSHKVICQAVETNRASHRIQELIRLGWSIEGAGVLGLDPRSQTQLYRLVTLELGLPRAKHLGMKIVWDERGLHVTLHRDMDGTLSPSVLARIRRNVESLVRAELLPDNDDAAPPEEE